MKKQSFHVTSILLVIVSLFFLQGCETLKGFSGGPKKISEGVGLDLRNTWDNILEFDSMMREKFW